MTRLLLIIFALIFSLSAYAAEMPGEADMAHSRKDIVGGVHIDPAEAGAIE